MSEEVEYVDPNLLKRDSAQPRTQESITDEEVEAIAKTFDFQGVINPIEVDENNVIILGERRWRASKLKGLKKIPIHRKTGLSQKERYERQAIDDGLKKELTYIERFWLYTTMLANINGKANYAIDDIKQMYKNDYEKLSNLITLGDKAGRGQEKGQSQLSQNIGTPQATLSNYMSFFKVCPEIQKIFLENGSKGERSKRVAVSHMAEIARLSAHPEAQKQLEDLFLEDLRNPIEKRQFPTMYEIRDYVTEYQEKLEKEAEKRAEEIAKERKEEPEPKVEPPKIEPSKEEIEKQAKKIVKKKNTILEKATASLNGVPTKINSAIKLGIDVTDFQERLDQAQLTKTSNPKEAYEEGKSLKQELDILIREAKKTEEELKREEQIRKEAEEEAKKKLLEDEEVRAKIFEEEQKRLEEERERLRGEAEQREVEISEEEKKTLEEFLATYKDALIKSQADYDRILIKSKDKEFQNMLRLFQGFIKERNVKCPICGETEISWRCGHGF